MLQIDKEISSLKERYKSFDATTTLFDDYPLSEKTKMGLNEYSFVTPTVIQKESIMPALLGNDIVGAAVTGSGKTLAFLIPVLENLFIKKWTRVDGLGVIIISPTRELAYQIFEMLRKVGKYHDFSAGLVIGGQNLKFERSRMDKCNILICTPGRLLQHMDENPLFDTCALQMLVLDEADRCLDMGFEKCLNAIIENLPPSRQNLLFSATQNCSMDVFTRLGMQNPVLTGTCDSTKLGLPELLHQSYVVVELEDKITMIWSFIKAHLKQKTIVFLTSCKQVKYMYEVFCKLRPGTSLLALYGTLNQDRRIEIYNEFVKKRNVVLFATDIASRGLDFPSVHWVIQLDCPEDVTQYIHRAGRSARNKAPGECLLVLMPSEENAMIRQLESKAISVKKIEIDKKRLFSCHAKIEALCAQNSELKASAQRAFVSYIKSICLMKNKDVFKVQNLNLDAYAKSLGLEITPRVRFLERSKQKHLTKGSPHLNKLEESDEELFKVKRFNHDIFDEDNNVSDENHTAFPRKNKVLTKAALAKKIIKKNIQANQKCRFEEDGNDEAAKSQFQPIIDVANERENHGIDLQISKNFLAEEDKLDKDRFKKLVKIRHRKQKEKFKKRKHFDSENENSLDEEYEEKDSRNEPSKIQEKTSKEPAENKPRNPNTVVKVKKTKTNLSLLDAEAIASQLLTIQ